MDNLLQSCRSITVDTKPFIDKDQFDENYGFRHIPVLFTNAFQNAQLTEDRSSSLVADKTYLSCWYEKYATENGPQKPDICFNTHEGLSFFKKNIWDLSSWYYLTRGEVHWLFFPPFTLEYLQLANSIPESSSQAGLFVDLHQIGEKYGIRPLQVIQRAGDLLFIPPFYGYSCKANQAVQATYQTILTEYNHDNLYAYFRKTVFKPAIKQTILDGFKNTKHLSNYETPIQRLSAAIHA